jgi:cytoskeletal protein CcmA (bactofilin family)
MDSKDKKTIIEKGTEFDGAVSSTCGIMLSGKMKGELSAPSLTVTESGSVHGQVMVEQLKSQGEISGEIDADIVELSGKVNDDTVIRANTLEVKLDQPDGGLRVAFGNCSLRVGEKPNQRKQAKSEQNQSNTSDKTDKTEEKAEPVMAKV